MGWTYTSLRDNRKSLEDAKREHVYDATRYSDNIKAEMLAYEWRPKTFFAIIKLNFLEGHAKADQSKTFLRIDLIDTAGGEFGYKDGAEEMGMYQDDKPSRIMAQKIYEFIPVAEGYAPEWRERNGIKYRQAEKQLEMI